MQFATSFFSVAMRGQQIGANGFSEIASLLDAAQKVGDQAATHAVWVLGTTLFPLLEALGKMAIGFPVFLITNLEYSYFLDEPTYLDSRRNALLPEASIVMNVTEPINAVLVEMKHKALPTKLRASDIRQIGVEEKEQQVLDLLRSRDFERLVIEPKSGGYHIEILRSCSVSDIDSIVSLLKGHKYQSVTVKMHGGNIVHISRSISVCSGHAKKNRPAEPHKNV
jgi:hypothetical protein